MSLLGQRPQVLLMGLLVAGCTIDRGSGTTEPKRFHAESTKVVEAASGDKLALVVPTEDDMIRLRTVVMGQKLGRMTAIADAFTIGYHRSTVATTPEEAQLDSEFFEALFAGRYDRIGEFKARYGALIPGGDPAAASALVVARLGFLNIWEVSERYRLLDAPGGLAPEQIQAVSEATGACANLFALAAAKEPTNAIYRGFAADCQLFLGVATNSAINTLNGLTYAVEAVRRNPEFNLFTVGYALSSLPADSQEFGLGLEMMFRDFDVCVDAKVDRDNPTVVPYLGRLPTALNKKYCGNTDKAAHNYEGFFLIFGDLLVKAGRPEVAKVMYANAKTLPSFSTWPFKHKIDERIAAAEQLVAPFAALVDPMVKPSYPTITFHSEYACMACHQKY